MIFAHLIRWNQIGNECGGGYCWESTRTSPNSMEMGMIEMLQKGYKI